MIQYKNLKQIKLIQIYKLFLLNKQHFLFLLKTITL